jgi:hypothetical protein
LRVVCQRFSVAGYIPAKADEVSNMWETQPSVISTAKTERSQQRQLVAFFVVDGPFFSISEASHAGSSLHCFHQRTRTRGRDGFPSGFSCCRSRFQWVQFLPEALLPDAVCCREWSPGTRSALPTGGGVVQNQHSDVRSSHQGRQYGSVVR